MRKYFCSDGLGFLPNHYHTLYLLVIFHVSFSICWQVAGHSYQRRLPYHRFFLFVPLQGLLSKIESEAK